MSEFILKGEEGIRDTIEAEGLIAAEDLARAWGEENGHTRVEIYDAESPGASALTTVVIPAEVKARWPRAFAAIAQGDDDEDAAEIILDVEERAATDAVHSIRQSEADGEWLTDAAARDGAAEDLAQTDAHALVEDEDGDEIAELRHVYVTAWTDTYRAARDA